MIVSLDWSRVLHLLLLLGITFTGGQLLIQKLEWGDLAAYAFSCSIVCQVSNTIIKITKEKGLTEELEKDKAEKQQSRIQKKKH